jgi:hypothetical protein
LRKPPHQIILGNDRANSNEFLPLISELAVEVDHEITGVYNHGQDIDEGTRLDFLKNHLK